MCTRFVDADTFVAVCEDPEPPHLPGDLRLCSFGSDGVPMAFRWPHSASNKRWKDAMTRPTIHRVKVSLTAIGTLLSYVLCTRSDGGAR